MKTRVYILVWVLGMITLSCNSFLDVEPKGKVIPKTVEDYDKLLNDPQLGGISNLIYMSPESQISVLPISGSDLRAYTWSDYQFLPGENDGNWENNYHRIAICNEIINHIDDLADPNGNVKLWTSVKGQAYAERARCYFALVNLYGAPYSKANREELGVPMILENDIYQQKPRATVGEIYDLICADLKVAENLVPLVVEPTKKHRACQQGLYAFKSKVYLFMNEIDSAYIAIERAFETEPVLDYIDDKGAKFTWYAEFHQVDEVIWASSSYFNSRSSQLYYTDFISLLYDHEQDKRYLFHAFLNDPNGPSYSIPRYLSCTNQTFAASSAEMYLLRAECLARKGKYEEAMEDLTTLRESRYENADAALITASSQMNAIQKVKEERLRELAFTGQYWLDLRRYQAYGEEVPTFTREVNGTVYTLAPGSKRYTLSIPRLVMAKNPNLVQNPR